jgi:hypothetical protein
VSTGNVFAGWINRVYPVSHWNFFVCHRCIVLYVLSNRNVLGFTRRDELYTVCPGDVFDVDRSKYSVLYTM